MSEQCPINVPCQVAGQTQTPLSDDDKFRYII